MQLEGAFTHELKYDYSLSLPGTALDSFTVQSQHKVPKWQTSGKILTKYSAMSEFRLSLDNLI
jgi:hypothetical protein